MATPYCVKVARFLSSLLVLFALAAGSHGEVKPKGISSSPAAAWATAVDTDGKSYQLKKDAFSNFWINCGEFSLAVEPDTVLTLAVTGKAKKVRNTSWYPVRAKTKQGPVITGQIDYSMSSCLTSSPWAPIRKKENLARLFFSPTAELPKREKTALHMEFKGRSGNIIRLSDVCTTESYCIAQPIKMDWRKEPKPWRMVFDRHELFSVQAGHFLIRARLSMIRSIARLDDSAAKMPDPWIGKPKTRPELVVFLGKRPKPMWAVRLSEWPGVAGRGPHGWTRVDAGKGVRGMGFTGPRSPDPKDEARALRDQLARLQPGRGNDPLLLGPAGMIEDSSGTTRSGTFIHQTWLQKKYFSGTLISIPWKRSPSVSLQVEGQKKPVDIPFARISTIVVGRKQDPLKLEIKKWDGTTVRGSFDAKTETYGERDLEMVSGVGIAKIAWVDVRKITFTPAAKGARASK